MPPKKPSIGHRTRHALKRRRQRQEESSEQSEERRAADRLRQKRRREMETEEEAEKRRKASRIWAREEKKAKEYKLRKITKTNSELPSLSTSTEMLMQQHFPDLPPARPAPEQKKVSTDPYFVPAQPAQRQEKVDPANVVVPPPIQFPAPIQVVKQKCIERPQPKEKQMFVVSNHQHCVMSSLASLWKSEKLCDAGIGNGSTIVMVHKLVLFAICPKLLPVSNLDIRTQEFLQVNFPKEVSEGALNAFAEYMYNGILDLDPDILEQMKIIAKRLDMAEFEQLCDSHLSNHLHQTSSVPFNNVPSIQTIQIPAMTSSSSSFDSTNFTQSTNPIIDNQQNISMDEEIQKKPSAAAVFSQQSDMASLALNMSEDSAGFVPSVKTEPVPLIPTAMDPSLAFTGSASMRSAPSNAIGVNEIEKEIPIAELRRVKKEPEEDVSPMTLSESGNNFECLMRPTIKIEPVGPDDDEYNPRSVGSCNQTFASNTPSSSFSSTTAALSTVSSPITAISTSSTKFAIPSSEAMNCKFTSSKAPQSSEAYPVSDLSLVSNIVEDVYSQSPQLGPETEKCHEQLVQSTNSQMTVKLIPNNKPNSVNEISCKTRHQPPYPIGLFISGGSNLIHLKTNLPDAKAV